MALTRDEAIEQINFFQRNYLPSRPDFAQDWTTRVDNGIEFLGRSPSTTMELIIPGMIGTAGQYEGAFPSHPVDMWAVNNGVAYANGVTPSELVGYFYPNATAADSSALVNALTNGTVTSIDFLTGWLPARMESPRPSAADVLEEIFDAGLGTPTLPTLSLGLPGVTDVQTEFLIGVYVAAFDRAPEHEGLKYWAGDLARLLAGGTSEADAMKQLAKSMYASGAQNGEGGTTLDHAAYVRFVYDTVLGREPDAGGAGYWTEQLQAGADRSEFIAPFLTSALAAAGDSDYVKARIAVAEYAAQAHVSGPGKIIDLADVLDDIDNAGDAYLAIQALATANPAPAAGAARLLSFAHDDDIDLSAFGGHATVSADTTGLADVAPEQSVTLVGVAAELDASLI